MEVTVYRSVIKCSMSNRQSCIRFWCIEQDGSKLLLLVSGNSVGLSVMIFTEAKRTTNSVISRIYAGVVIKVATALLIPPESI